LHRFAVLEDNALEQQFDLFRAVDTAPGLFGLLDQLKCLSEEGGRDTQLRVRVVRWRTVANVDSIALVVRRCCQCSAGNA
jgi:hypothetical protein